MELLERFEPELNTEALTGGNPMHRVLLVANASAIAFTGWARLAVDFQTRRRYAIKISDASGATCQHIVTDEHIGERNTDTGKFRWAFTLWFEVSIEPKHLGGFLAEWTSESDCIASRTPFTPPERWLPALEAHSHPGRLALPHTLPVA